MSLQDQMQNRQDQLNQLSAGESTQGSGGTLQAGGTMPDGTSGHSAVNPQSPAPSPTASPAPSPTGSSYGMTQDQTVEGRLGGILGQESPLMQRAATSGMQFANQRGLLNSSMAAGAAQGAMIDRAMPIAQQDAQQAWQRDNMNLEHDFTTGRDATQQGYHQDNMNLGHTQNMERDQAGFDQQRTMTELSHVLGMEHMEFAKNLDQQHQIQLMEIGQDFQRLGQYESGLTNVWNGMLNMITQSGATTPEQIQHMMNQMMPIMNNTRDFFTSLYGNMGGQQ